MKTNESINIWGEKSFYIPLFVFVYWTCVCVFALWVSVNIRTLVCVIVFPVRPPVCVYICTEFYFASLIQNNIVYRFYSV